MVANNDLELQNTTFRLYAIHRDMVIRAAALVPDRSLSDYCRDVVIEAAARDLGEAVPSVPPIHRGRYGSIVAQAAAKLGMSHEEFERQASRYFATSVLQSNAVENRGSSPPPPRKPSGLYSKAVSEAPAARKAR